MATHCISRFMLIIVLVALSFHKSGASNEEKTHPMAPPTDPSTNILRVDLIHRDSPLSPSLESRSISNVERLRRAIDRSHRRWGRFQHYTSQNDQSYYSPLNYVEGEYFMQMEIGSPVPLNLHFILDTGSDLIWTQCQPCSNSCVPQTDPIYTPFNSSSYTNVSCSSPFCLVFNVLGESSSCDFLQNCNYTYAYLNASTSGVLAEETFSLPIAGSRARTSFPNLTFGCGHVQQGDFSGSSGIVGMARGKLSLVSQIGSSIFSYCLRSLYNTSQISPLFLGPAATLGGGYSVTTLIQNDVESDMHSFYYLDLHGISVSGKPVPIPNGTFQLQANGSGGFLIDSGTTLSFFAEAGYVPFRDAVRSSITAQPVNATGSELCYLFTSGLVFPNITLHFAGGADYVLPPENSFISYQQDTGELVCLAFLASLYPFSVLGNFQQQNFHIVYDLGNNKLSFAPSNCDAM